MSEEIQKPDLALFRGRQIDKISAALAKAQGAFPEIKKNREVEVEMKSGGKYIFHYADLAEIFGATRPALSANELCLFQHTEVLPNGRDLLETILSHSSGQYLQSETTLPIATDMKTKGGNLTYEKRYQAQMMLGVAAEDDLDVKGVGEQGVGEQGAAKPRPPASDRPPSRPAAKPPGAPVAPPTQKEEPMKEIGPAEEKARMEAIQAVRAAAKAGGWSEEQVALYVKTNFKAYSIKNLSILSLERLMKKIQTEHPPKIPEAGPAVIPPPASPPPGKAPPPPFDESP